MNIPTKLAPAIALALSITAIGAQAATPLTGDILVLDDGVPTYDTYGNISNVTSGSWFGMDNSGNGSIAGTEKNPITNVNGITIGVLQGANEIDAWSFFGSPGTHMTVGTPITGDTTAGLNFSGWTVYWNATQIPMPSGAWTPGNCAVLGCSGITFGEGVASFSWSGVYGDPFTLWYSATVPASPPSGYEGVAYLLRLTGTVLSAGTNVPPSAVPVTISALAAGGTTNWTPNVSDPDTGDTLTCSIQAGDEPANGTATIASDCTTGTYTHTNLAATTDTFTYTVTDGTDTDTAVVSVTISSGGGGGGGGDAGTLPNGVVVLELDAGVQELTPEGDKLNVSAGSWFGMDMDGNSRMAGSEKTALQPGPDGGLIIGAIQAASGTHQGAPNGSENASVDAPWAFFGNTGMHFTTVAPSAIGGNTANGIDMSGWRVTWNAIPIINMGAGAWNPLNCDALNITTCSFANGAGQFTYTDVDGNGNISDGDTYRLIYAATVPEGDPSGFGRVRYLLNLEGAVSVIPAPTSTGVLQNGDFGGTATNGYRATTALPADPDHSNVGGYFDYKVVCAGTCDTFITLTAPIPANAVLRKYGVTPGNPAGGWSTFDGTGGDSLASADRASGSGDCAAATYTPGLTAGHDCLRITQADGGRNDTDAAAGVIGDPSGIAVPAAVAAAPDLSSGSSGCTIAGRPLSMAKAGDWLVIGLALAGLAFFRRRTI